MPSRNLLAQGLVGEHDVERAGGDATDVDGVDPHPRGQLGRDVARHPIERRLGRAVGNEHRLGHAGRTGRDIDHRSPADGVDHLPCRQFGERQRGGHVEREGPGHETLARLHGRPGHGAAGVVDQDVEAPELLDRPLHQLFARGGVGDVGWHDEGTAAEGSDPLSHLLEVGLRTSSQCDVRTGLGQPDGDPPSDPEPGARDDRHLSGDGEAVEDHAWAGDEVARRSRCRPGAARPATKGISR